MTMPIILQCLIYQLSGWILPHPWYDFAYSNNISNKFSIPDIFMLPNGVLSHIIKMVTNYDALLWHHISIMLSQFTDSPGVCSTSILHHQQKSIKEPYYRPFVSGGLPSQRTNNVEIVSIMRPWRKNRLRFPLIIPCSIWLSLHQ